MNMSQPEPFRNQAPPPLAPRPIVIPNARETQFANGLGLLVIEDDRLPLVSYRLALRVGTAYDPPGLPGLTDLLAGLLPEGTQSRSSREIAEKVARMGASLTAGANSDYTIVAASGTRSFPKRNTRLDGRGCFAAFVSRERS
jgi:zinc protease